MLVSHIATLASSIVATLWWAIAPTSLTAALATS
jgi:hypothetical protein